MKKDVLQKLKRIFVRILFWFFGLSIGSVLLFRFVPVPLTPLMIIRLFEQGLSGENFKLYKEWTPLDKIGSRMPDAVIASEDQKFEEHSGFDFEAIRKARSYNERHQGGKMKGASTISQQTAKNVFLWPSRSWIRKGFEVYFTFLIEVFWSKERIMEVYLNVIEMGDGVYGAEAAAQTFFKKPSKKLSSRQAALIAAVLPNPRRWSPSHPTVYITRKAARIEYYMRGIDFGQ